MSVGASGAFSIVAHPVATGWFNIASRVDGSSIDPNLSNNQTAGSITLTEVAIADVAVTSFTGYRNFDDSIYFTATVSNLGDDDAADVVFSLTLPTLPYSFQSADCVVSADTVACGIGSIPVGGSVEVAFVADSGWGFFAAGKAYGAAADPSADNNVATLMCGDWLSASAWHLPPQRGFGGSWCDFTADR